MKILYHHRIASKDGQFVHIEEIIHSLRKQGHVVRVVSPSVNDNQEFGGEGGFVSDLKARLPGAVYELMEFTYAFVAFFKLLFQALIFRPDGIYERFNLFLPSGIWVSRLTGIPLLLEVNAPLYEERLKYNGIELKKLARWSQAYVLENAHKVLPVTQVMADLLTEFMQEEGKVLHRDKVVVIPNGVNTERFIDNHDRAELPAAFEGAVVVGFVGFCREWHGLDQVIDTLSDLRDLNIALLIVGDGPVIPDLIKQAESLGIKERVHFTGLVGRDEMPQYVEVMDITLQPSVVDYASPLKLLEYMGKGKAILAPDQPNIKELVADHKNALLFNPQDNRDFKESLRRLCEDQPLRERLGAEAKNEVLQRPLTWDSNAARICNLFSGLRSR